MAAISLYTISVPVFTRHLKILKSILQKGEAWAKENNVPVEDLLAARLAPDMLPLPKQIQIASNTAKAALPRLAGYEPTPMDDNETTFEELYERIDKTVAVLEKADSKDFEGKEANEVSIPVGQGKEMKFAAVDSVLLFSLPNFYFHVTTAYDILRNKGVPIGKRDYLYE